MTASKPTVLVVDDDTTVSGLVTALLEDEGYDVLEAADLSSAMAHVRANPVDLALVDLRLGAENGLDLLDRIKKLRPETSVIMITAQGSIEAAVDAMRRGADNFIPKPIEPARLLALIEKGCEAGTLRRQGQRLGRLGAREPVTVFGQEPGVVEALRLADAVAARDTTVLLQGETGTGKGLLARYIHDRSPRRARPFVELNCAGLHRDLTESELFGHERGAFTGATERKLGLFEAADGGTLLLDEIGEMELAVQAKLLKVLEERRFRRVGGLAEISADTRVIAATHRDLEARSREGTFREDLFFRLGVFVIRVPPLRERPADIVPLALRFLSEFRGAPVEPNGALSEEAAATLRRYPWPGNVRELRNVIERATILCPPGGPVLPSHLPPLGERSSGPTSPAPPGREAVAGATLEEAEKRLVEDALRASGGNILAAARELGVTRPTLYRKIRKYGLRVTDDEPPGGDDA